MKYTTKTIDRIVSIGAMIERLRTDHKTNKQLLDAGWLNGAGELYFARQQALIEGQIDAGIDAIAKLLAVGSEARAEAAKLREVLEQMIEGLEDLGFSLEDSDQLPVAGCIPDDAPVQINGGDVVDFLNEQFPLLKAAL